MKKEWEFIRGLVLSIKCKYFNIFHVKGKKRRMTHKTIKIRILIYYKFKSKRKSEFLMLRYLHMTYKFVENIFFPKNYRYALSTLKIVNIIFFSLNYWKLLINVTF